jgi:hypothetical protein
MGFLSVLLADHTPGTIRPVSEGCAWYCIASKIETALPRLPMRLY